MNEIDWEMTAYAHHRDKEALIEGIHSVLCYIEDVQAEEELKELVNKFDLKIRTK